MRVKWAFLAGWALFLAGCAPQFDRIEEGVIRNGRAIEDLQREQVLLRQQVDSIDALLRLDQDVGMQTDARGSAKLGHLTQQIDQLMQKLDDNAAFMRSLSARVDLLATRAGVPPLGEARSGPAAMVTSGALPEEGLAIYQAALRDRSRGEADLARQGFKEFLSRYGQSELADDAAYWLAELDYAEGRYAEALGAFEGVLARYPGSELAPAVELKAAYCLLASGQEEEGRRALQRLIDRHPQAEEAGLARERLAADR